MFVDTVAALVVLDRDLAPSLFQGGAVSEDFSTGERSARLYRNIPTEPARCTWWPQTHTLRIEFSSAKLGGLESALMQVDGWARSTFGLLPPVQGWRCQRVDFYVDIQVGQHVQEYLSVLRDLRVGSWTRVPFAKQGVVWKSAGEAGRWVKFYDKSRESNGQPGVLRFEVSNFRDSLRYMAEKWFVCERTVEQMTRPGRAAFVLAHFWDKLGLGTNLIGQRQHELHELKAVFGARSLALAAHALMCIRQHGPASYSTLGLISKSSYYRWLRELRDHGFLTASKRRGLAALRLPIESAFDESIPQNLKVSLSSLAVLTEKNSAKNFWLFLAENLGLNPQNPPNSLVRSAYEWLGYPLDSVSGAVPVNDSVFSLSAAASGTAAGTGLERGFKGRHRSAQVAAHSGSKGSERKRSSVGRAAGASVGGRP